MLWQGDCAPAPRHGRASHRADSGSCWRRLTRAQSLLALAVSAPAGLPSPSVPHSGAAAVRPLASGAVNGSGSGPQAPVVAQLASRGRRDGSRLAPSLAPRARQRANRDHAIGPLTSVGVAGFEPTTSSSRIRPWKIANHAILAKVQFRALVGVGLRWALAAPISRSSPGFLHDSAGGAPS
jgi:hypothetical protein